MGILTLAGSTRDGSFNKKLAKLGADLINQKKMQAEFVDLKDYPLPLYDGDYESNNSYPKNAQKLKDIFKSHNGLLIASPEYNSSISAVLKNMIDWITRSDTKGTDLTALTGKVVAIVSTSPGGLGGLRGLVHLRSIMGNLGCFVIPNQLAIPQAHAQFEDESKIKDDVKQSQFEDLIEALMNASKRFQIDLNSYCKQLYKDFNFKD